MPHGLPGRQDCSLPEPTSPKVPDSGHCPLLESHKKSMIILVSTQDETKNRTHSHLLQLNLISKISLPSTLSYRMKSPMSLWLIIHMGQEEKVEQAEGPKLSHQDSQLPIGFYVFSFHRGSPVATFLGKLISKYKRKGKKR